MDNLKIRLSYGSLGNQQIGYYDFIQTITTKGSMSDYSFDGTVLGQHATVSDPVSGDQTWEKVVSKNLGLDLNMFNNRLSISVIRKAFWARANRCRRSTARASRR